MSGARPDPDPVPALKDLVEVVAQLRGPRGCPWDRAQDHRTLVPYLVEEAYEAAEAVTDGSAEEMKDELGDVLLQVLLHAQIEAEEGRFGIAEVAESLRAKLVRRHPHVFGEERADTANEVRTKWEEIKDREGRPKRERRLPALIAAAKFVEVQEAAGRPVPIGVWLRHPETALHRERIVGEILLEAVAVARKLGCDAEMSLQKLIAEGANG